MPAYFDKRSLLAQDLLEAVLEEADLSVGPDGTIWSYELGVWQRDPDAVYRAISPLLGNRYRLEHERIVIRMVEGDPPVRLEDRGMLTHLNFRNGMLNLETLELEAHRQDPPSMAQLPHEWDPDAPAPVRFERFLEEVAPGKEKLLLELLGYSMLDGNPFQKAGMLTGSGANGKGVFMHLVGAAVGLENRSSVTLHELSKNPYAVADLSGKLVNLAGDLSSGRIEDSSMFKRITGGDSLRAERKYEHGFSFTARAFSMFSANEVPGSGDVGYGYMRRWVPIHFPNRFDEAHRQTDLLEELSGELDGIIRLGVMALAEMLQAGGFDKGLVADGLEAFKLAIDPVRVFVAEKLQRIEGKFLSRRDLYRVYREWAEENGQGRLAAAKFYRRFREAIEETTGAPVEDKMLHGDRGFRDLMWSGPADEAPFEAPREAPL